MVLYALHLFGLHSIIIVVDTFSRRHSPRNRLCSGTTTTRSIATLTESWYWDRTLDDVQQLDREDEQGRAILHSSW